MRAGAVAIALLALALSGCGTEGSERGARGSVQRFFAALGRHDGEGACKELSEEAASAVEGDEKKPCGEAILSLGLATAPINKVSVYVDSAQAKLAGGGAVFLDETSAGWKISAAGCKPQPDGMPYDCELEA
jgi:hypothetical protein